MKVITHWFYFFPSSGNLDLTFLCSFKTIVLLKGIIPFWGKKQTTTNQVVIL